VNHFAPDAVLVKEKTLDFEHIPTSEREQEWWVLLLPLIKARIRRGNLENSNLLKVLSSTAESDPWKRIKKCIEIACKNAHNGHRILSRTSEIKKSPNPDGIIDDMFAELRTVPYLLMKGFENISYFRRNGLDFTAEFQGHVFHIESTYVHGPDFKTQEYLYAVNQESLPPIFKIHPEKLIQLLNRKYTEKKDQIQRHQGSIQNSLLFMITDLEETYAPWLEHAQVQGNHPILNLLLSWEFPTVIFGSGSVYEPRPECLNGAFGSMNRFDWPQFAKLFE
jgi:hypothetical protein